MRANPPRIRMLDSISVSEVLWPTVMVRHIPVALALAAAVSVVAARPVSADSAAEVDAEARAALNRLYKKEPIAKVLAGKAKAILVFPTMIKAGFMVGGQYGKGVLFKQNKIAGHYNSVAASYGLQAGAQSFGYALFLMSKTAVEYLGHSDGWELGVGPSVVVVDEGMARTLTTTTLKDDVYAFIFDQKGLMAGVGIQGSKITKVSD